MSTVSRAQTGPHAGSGQAGELAGSTGTLELIVRRIVAAADPDRIILFGSAARGEAGPDSDLDLLVVKAELTNSARLYEAIYANLIGVGQAVDVLMVTPDDLERYRNSHALVIKPALHEGKTIYVRAVPA